MSAMGYFRRFDAIRFYVGYHSDRDVTLAMFVLCLVY
jgi:hypothetical protein